MTQFQFLQALGKVENEAGLTEVDRQHLDRWRNDPHPAFVRDAR